ncbi:tetratricopeptide repeat protein [Candidatus Nitrotoga fabula]|uniref:Tetratricopeptide repeat protein n=1 Tax=Candidatus Nitrotoga fabula TaxID=2182327 RepID=A0A916BDH0_9PROT|nr:tetratricopeptide repeat protein [Candidatus Nitrotoga fabula]CAE6703844.1 exported hypothetical protein [Candidatus Nitrotoga fabula]
MKKIISIILCGMFFLFLPTLAAPVQPAKLPSKPGAIQITSQASDISTNLKLQQQKLEFFKERLDLQDKRISDLNFYLSCFGVLMTVIVVFFSFRSTREAVQAAKDEARNEVKAQAKNIIESWLDKDGKQELVKKVEDTLNPKIAIALGEIDNKATNVLNKLEDERRTTQMINDKSLELQARHERAMINLSHSIDTTKPLSEKQREKVQEAAQEIESRAPNKYRFEDWNMLGIQAFESAKYEVALTQFIRAEKVSSEPIQLSKALVNKGAALAQMGRNEEAIAAYDEVVHRFGEATEEPLREQVATALMNKGKTLGKMGRDEEAIAVYDKVVRHFGEATEAPLREQVATALVNKGGTLDQMEWNNEAIAAYDEVVRRFGEATEAPLREQVATALMNKGKTLGKMGRDEEAIAVYDEVARLFGEEKETPLRMKVSETLLSKGVVLENIGRSKEADAVYDELARRLGEEKELPLLKPMILIIIWMYKSVRRLFSWSVSNRRRHKK